MLIIALRYGYLDIQNSEENTSLFIATVYGYYDIVKLLILYEVNINKQNYDGNNSIMLATKFNCYYIVLLLLKNHVETDLPNIYNETTFEIALNNEFKSLIKILR